MSQIISIRRRTEAPDLAAEAELWLWPFLVALLTRLPDLFLHYRDWDEAAMMSQAWAMTQSQVLYRDVYQIHPPLQFLVFVPFFKVLAASAAPHAIKVLNLGLAWLTARLAAGLVRFWTKDRAAALASGVLAAWLLGRDWSVSSYGEFYMLLPLLGSLALLRGPRPRWAAAGALWGVAFFLKQVAVFDAAALAAGTLWAGGADARRAARSLARAAAGFAAVALAVVAWMAAQGALGDMVRLVLLSPLRHYAAPGVPLAFRAGAFFDLIVARAVLVFAPCWLFVAAGALSGRRPAGEPRRAAAVCGLWLAAALLEIWSIGKLHFHYALALVPPATLLAGLFAARLPERRLSAARALAAVLVLAAAVPCAGALRRLAAVGWREPGARSSQALAAEIRADTRDGDRIFVYGVTNLDLYYLSGRTAAQGVYMYVDVESRHGHDPELEARFESGMRADPPALIVANRAPDFRASAEPELLAFMDALLAERYERLDTVGIADLYALKGR